MSKITVVPPTPKFSRETENFLEKAYIRGWDAYFKMYGRASYSFSHPHNIEAWQNGWDEAQAADPGLKMDTSEYDDALAAVEAYRSVTEGK